MILSNKGTLSGLAAVLLWASAAAFIAAAKGVHPFLYYGTEMVIGVLIFAAYWLKRGHDPRPEWKKVPYWYIALGIVGIGLQGVCWVAAIQHAPPLEAILFIYQWPMLVVLFTAIALKNPLKPHHFVALLGGFLGVLVVLIGRGLILLAGGCFNLLIWAIGFGAPLPPVNGFIICLMGFASFSIPVLSALLLAITGQDRFSWYTILGLGIVMAALAIAKFTPQDTKA